MQMDPVIRTRRKVFREAVAWLNARAREMNGPHARQVLNSATFVWSCEKLRVFDPVTGKAGRTGIGPDDPSLAFVDLEAPQAATVPDVRS